MFDNSYSRRLYYLHDLMVRWVVLMFLYMSLFECLRSVKTFKSASTFWSTMEMHVHHWIPSSCSKISFTHARIVFSLMMKNCRLEMPNWKKKKKNMWSWIIIWENDSHVYQNFVWLMVLNQVKSIVWQLLFH